MDHEDADSFTNCEEEAERINEEDIDQIIELDDAGAPDHFASDDEDQQSTSNMSGIDEREEWDDSVCALQAHEKDCFTLALAGSRWLASGGEDDVAYLWDQTVSESDAVLKVTHTDSVTAVAFNSAETLLATGDMKGKIIVTQLSDLKTRVEISDCNDLEWMHWHTSSDILFAGDSDGIIWMWLIGAKGIVQSKVFAAGGAPCTVGQLLADGKRLLAGYNDGSIRLWSLKDQTSLQLNFRSPITAIHHHITQPVAVIGTQSGTLSIVNTGQEDKMRKVALFPGLSEPKHVEEGEEEDLNQCVECVALAPYHPWVAVGRNDGSLCVYEIDSSFPRSIYRSPQAQAMVRAVWSMEGITPLLSVASVDGTIRIFDARDGSVYKELRSAGDEILDMAVVDTNPLRLMTACGGGVIRMFDLSKDTSPTNV